MRIEARPGGVLVVPRDMTRIAHPTWRPNFRVVQPEDTPILMPPDCKTTLPAILCECGRYLIEVRP